MANILAVVTSVHALSNGGATGFWLEELSEPYFRFTQAGHTVLIASPAGGAVKPDAASLEEPFISDAGRRLMDDPEAQKKLAATTALADVDSAAIDAIFLVGGVGAAYDFNGNPHLDALVGKLANGGKIVSGVCHGVIGLTTVGGQDGVPIARGQKMTGFSRAEEVAMNLLSVVPVVPEDRLREVGATYVSAPELFGACVTEGPLFITGQNPASAAGVADAVVARLAAA